MLTNTFIITSTDSHLSNVNTMKIRECLEYEFLNRVLDQPMATAVILKIVHPFTNVLDLKLSNKRNFHSAAVRHKWQA